MQENDPVNKSESKVSAWKKELIIIAAAEVSNTIFKPDTKRSTQFVVSEFKGRC